MTADGFSGSARPFPLFFRVVVGAGIVFIACSAPERLDSYCVEVFNLVTGILEGNVEDQLNILTFRLGSLKWQINRHAYWCDA